MDIYEKFGDFLLNLIQLIVGGIIFAAIMDNKSINSLTLCIIASIVVIIMLTGVFLLYNIIKKKKKRNNKEV
jgi:membrane protein DedA with SNARE-associated domain